MPDFVHESVLVGEVLEHLSPREDGVYVDCTVGGGGHSSAIPGRLIGIDRDPAALAAAAIRLGVGTETNPGTERERITLVHGELGNIRKILADLGVDKVDGFLADLGVSSPQLDHADRGFSFAKEGPLDMRMDPTRGQTALDLLRSIDVDALGTVIGELGEERYAKRIARLIKEAIREDRIETTTDLAKVVAQGIPVVEQRKSKIHPATRTFQALRIAVNAELDQLTQFLAAFPDLLKPGGRCVIISFHSLEDRLVKNAFRDLTWTSSLPARLAADAGERVAPVVEVLTRKAVFATEAEVERNPRARSARLRACMRLDTPNVPARR
ncbi:MAG TPA: 16S rRNA (cytosine(1402)-N(4))-methyltransferase RsmH [Kofleriaceae bacterium]|nr:16S rRNA (cytosine(1402)-N(4))-methyltransferase RsmH [Kofleriaceae bacterium]